MNRRKFLAASGGLSTALAGCLGTATSCQSGRKRIDGEWTVERGPLGGFSLTLSNDTVDHGAQLTARLRNETNEDQSSGNRFVYDVQRRTDRGWRSIFHIPQTSYWEGEAIIHDPGTGFTWDLTISQEGLQRTDEGQPEYYVCESVEPDAYRFVYHGLITAAESEGTERAIGAEFRVTET